MLLTDNTPTHMLADAEVEQEHGFNVNLSHLKIVFLPANTTSVVQSYTRA
jgi:ornithine carbamoyltransferase